MNYDESSERAIGDREGGYDQYDNETDGDIGGYILERILRNFCLWIPQKLNFSYKFMTRR